MRRGQPRRVAWLAALFLATLASSPAQGAEVLTVPLTYCEITNSIFVDDLLFRDVPVRARPNPFAKEPAVGASAVSRGVLSFGGGSSNAVSFLWQTGARRLFLDLNRNHDLTDDAPGPLFGRPTGPQAHWIAHQVFTNVHLAFPATSAGAPLMVDLNCIQIGNSNVPMVNVMARSYWRGKVAVAGAEWEVGLLPNLSDQPGSFRRGQMLLRPWEERQKLFYGWCDPVDAWALPFEYRCRALKAADAFEFSPRVFFEGRAWEVDWGAEPATGEGGFAVRLREQQPALGELKITGRFVDRVVMTGGPYAVVLVRPGPSVQVPAGRYYQPSLWLKQGRQTAYFNSLPRSGQPTISDPRLGGVRPALRGGGGRASAWWWTGEARGAGHGRAADQLAGGEPAWARAEAQAPPARRRRWRIQAVGVLANQRERAAAVHGL